MISQDTLRNWLRLNIVYEVKSGCCYRLCCVAYLCVVRHSHEQLKT